MKTDEELMQILHALVEREEELDIEFFIQREKSLIEDRLNELNRNVQLDVYRDKVDAKDSTWLCCKIDEQVAAESEFHFIFERVRWPHGGVSTRKTSAVIDAAKRIRDDMQAANSRGKPLPISDQPANAQRLKNAEAEYRKMVATWEENIAEYGVITTLIDALKIAKDESEDVIKKLFSWYLNEGFIEHGQLTKTLQATVYFRAYDLDRSEYITELAALLEENAA